MVTAAAVVTTAAMVIRAGLVTRVAAVGDYVGDVFVGDCWR